MRNAIMANTFMAGISALLAGYSLDLLFDSGTLVAIEEVMVGVESPTLWLGGLPDSRNPLPITNCSSGLP